MYNNSAAEIRHDLQVVVMEARAADDKFIGNQVFPEYPVDIRTGDFTKILKGSGGLLATEGSDALVRAPGTAYKATGRTTAKDGYRCVDRGLIEPVDDTNAQDLARYFDAESASAKLCERNVRIAYEQRVAAKTFDTAQWGATGAIVPYTYANKATIDFIEDVKAMIRLVNMRGEQANTLILNKALWDLVKASTLLRTYFFGANGGGAQVTPELVAADLKLQNILVPESSYSVSKKGKDVTDADLRYIWPATHLWVGEVKGGAPEEGGAGRTFVLAPMAEDLIVVESYREEAIRSNVVRVRQDTDEKIINQCSGTLLTTSSDL